jgi:hypothetical protein
MDLREPMFGDYSHRHSEEEQEPYLTYDRTPALLLLRDVLALVDTPSDVTSAPDGSSVGEVAWVHQRAAV